MTTATWTIEVTFTEAPDGWVLTDATIAPAGSAAVWEAVSRVAHIIAEQSKADGPMSGGEYQP